MPKVLVLLIIFCFNNKLCASHDHTIVPYNPEKTKQLKEAVQRAHDFDTTPQTRAALWWHDVTKMLHIPIYGFSKLLEQGADPQALTFPGDPCPLSSAVAFTKSRITELCLTRGVDPNYQDPTTRDTPLLRLCSISKKHPEIFLEKLALLYFFQASLEARNWLGQTPRNIISKKNPHKIVDFERCVFATSLHRDLKKKQTDNARLPLLQEHLPRDLALAVNEYSDDAFWDSDCWPAIRAWWKPPLWKRLKNRLS